jgi:hypothetical protein
VDRGDVLYSPYLLATAIDWLAGLPFKGKVLVFACTVFVIELAFRNIAPKSKAYAVWTKIFQTIGKFWTAVILSVVYFLSVAVVAIGMKIFGKDPLDRTLDKEPSFWRKHEPNPLEPHAAARHQF